MKKIEMRKASGSLSDYVEEARKDPIIVVKNGRPVAAVFPIENADMETISLSTSRRFLSIIKRSRARHKKEGGISSRDMRRRLGLD